METVIVVVMVIFHITTLMMIPINRIMVVGSHYPSEATNCTIACRILFTSAVMPITAAALEEFASFIFCFKFYKLVFH